MNKVELLAVKHILKEVQRTQGCKSSTSGWCKDRRPSDQGGHIVGRDLNGDGGAGNLVAMDYRINQKRLQANGK